MPYFEQSRDKIIQRREKEKLFNNYDREMPYSEQSREIEMEK